LKSLNQLANGFYLDHMVGGFASFVPPRSGLIVDIAEVDIFAAPF
jgi:hypothetical protein